MEGTISTRLYSGMELTVCLERAGFSAIQLHGKLVLLNQEIDAYMNA
jgi:hypothetical protein